MRPVGRFLWILLFCLGLAVPAGFVSGALAQATTSMCNGDDALVGVANAMYVITNKTGNPLQPVMTPVYINFAIASCAPLEDGELGEAYTADSAIQFPMIPITQPSGTAPKTCGSGRLVTTLQGVTADGMVNDFRFGCTEPGGGGNVRFTKGPSNADFEDQCSKGQYANGITALPTGNIGFAEFGIKCVKMKASHRNDDEDEEHADDEDEGGDEANFLDFGNLHFQIDVNGATLKFGKKGKVRVVDEPTTLYKGKGKGELGYFDAGDKVTVLACEDQGRGWCAVIKPEAGYVWGSDLE